jgi:hypothetical protein
MNTNKPEKRNLFKIPLSAEALRVARAIYNTYLINEEESRLQIKIQNIINLLKLQEKENALEYILEIFEELNEPLEVLDFNYQANFYPRRFIFFFKYEIIHDTIAIDISNEYLHAHDNYMSDTFLK